MNQAAIDSHDPDPQQPTERTQLRKTFRQAAFMVMLIVLAAFTGKFLGREMALDEFQNGILFQQMELAGVMQTGWVDSETYYFLLDERKVLWTPETRGRLVSECLAIRGVSSVRFPAGTLLYVKGNMKHAVFPILRIIGAVMLPNTTTVTLRGLPLKGER